MIVICGRTCAGKDTLGKWLEERHGFEKVISYTTRPPREGEVDGKDYYFITSVTFDKMRSNGDFAETTDYKQENGDIWSYGTHVNSYRDIKKKEYVILNPEGIYQLVNRNIHFDLFYIDSKNKVELERRYRNREYADTHWEPWIDEKFETRWRQDEKDFNAFDEWLKKAKTEEGLPSQVKSICHISLNDKSRVSGITRKLKDLGYIDKTIKPDEFKEVLDEKDNELKEKLNEIYGIRNALNKKDKEYEELKYKYEELLKDHDAISCSKKHLHEMLSKEIEDRHKLEEKCESLECDIEKYKKSYDELFEKYKANIDRINLLETKNCIAQYIKHDEIALENEKLKEENDIFHEKYKTTLNYANELESKNDILKKQDEQLLMVLALTVAYLENKEDSKMKDDYKVTCHNCGVEDDIKKMVPVRKSKDGVWAFLCEDCMKEIHDMREVKGDKDE